MTEPQAKGKAKQKLELTWVGKDERPRLEPRILLEDPELSHHADKRYGEHDCFDNILIQGDNLLALKALEQKYAGQVKCIYIDPPFNTGAAFDNYHDGLEHSIWLGLIRERLIMLHSLMSQQGSIFIHLDDNEIDYAKIICDEVFGRSNFINRITVDARSPSSFSTVNPGVFKSSEYILWYSKDKTQFTERSGRVKRDPDYAYNCWLDNPNDDPSEWRFGTLLDVYQASPKSRSQRPETMIRHYNKFIVQNAEKICRFAEISDSGAGKKIVELKHLSKENPEKVFKFQRKGFDDIFIKNGQQVIFYSKNVHIIDGEKTASKLMTNIWSDIGWEGIAGEGGIKFKKGKKPEKLIKRCIELTSNSGDLVLDSFAGSGTTAAVAHKMGRRWITIEIGEHAHTHIVPRLKSIIDGTDQSGVTKVTGWKGGGGFRFYHLASPLLEKDPFGHWIISKDYNAEMLSEAMCKLMGFIYAPSKTDSWNHGYSTENDFIFVTTNTITQETLTWLAAEIGEDRSLLICCKAFNTDPHSFDNLTLKKIPDTVLGKCEWGRDDYALNVKNLPMAEEDNHDLCDMMEYENAK